MAIRVLGQVARLTLVVVDNATDTQVAPATITATVKPPGGGANISLTVTPATDSAGKPIFGTEYEATLIGTHYLRVETTNPNGAAETIIEIAPSQVI